MKTRTFISTLLLLFTIPFSFGQFSRSYLNISKTQHQGTIFTSYMYRNTQQENCLATLTYDNNNNLVIINQKIDQFGTLYDFTKLKMPISYNQELRSSILGVFIKNNFQYYIINVSGNLNKLIWLKVNQQNGILVDYFYSNAQVYSNYIGAKQNNNKIITYALKMGGGLTRFAMDLNNFGQVNTEIVDNTITSNSVAPNRGYFYKYGSKLGTVEIINGKEYLVVINSNKKCKVLIRDSPNNYTSFTTNISVANQGALNAFKISPTKLAITNGYKIEIYNPLGNLIQSGNFSYNVNTRKVLITYKNGTYYVFWSDDNSLSSNYLIADNNFNVLQKEEKENSIKLYQVRNFGNTTFLIGEAARTKVYLYELDNITRMGGKPVFFESFTTTPKLRVNEYAYGNYTGGTSKLHGEIGLGTRFLFSPQQREPMLYGNSPLTFAMNEMYLGITKSKDTIKSQIFRLEKEYPGPFTNYSAYDEIVESKYNHSFHVSRSMIQNHLDSLQMGSANYVPKRGIRSWPAHGNTAKGQAANLAPFIDENNNGIYDPMQGDYPKIYGEDCLLSITFYRDSLMKNKGLEFHSYIYTQSCDTSTTFDNTFFRKLKVISRGVEIDSFYMGVYEDGDIGFPENNYMGTNVDLGMGYFYYGYLFDMGFFGYSGFHDTLAAQGVMLLKGFPEPKNGKDNSFGIGENESVNGYGYGDGVIDNEYKGLYATVPIVRPDLNPHPETNIDIIDYKFEHGRNVLSGIWSQGDSIYYGGDGYLSSNYQDSLSTRYAYPRTEDTYHFGTRGIDPGYSWSQFGIYGKNSSSLNSSDVRMVLSFGYGKLPLNDTLVFDYAYIAYRDSIKTKTLFQPVEGLFDKGRKIRQAFLSNNGPCGINFNPVPPTLSLAEIENKKGKIIVYPNPSKGAIQITNIQKNATIEIFDMSGRMLKKVPNYTSLQRISIRELNNGLFLLKIKMQNQIYIKKIIKE